MHFFYARDFHMLRTYLTLSFGVIKVAKAFLAEEGEVVQLLPLAAQLMSMLLKPRGPR